MIPDRDDAATVRAKHSCIGPLAFHIDGFAALLCGEGYAPKTVHEKGALLADLSRWLDRHGLPLDGLDERQFRRFRADRRRRGKERRIEAMTGRQLLGYLRELDCIPSLLQTIDRTPVGDLTQDFERFLRSERGLSPATSTNYLPVVRRFLIEHFGRSSLRLDELRSVDIHRFILRHAEKGSRRTAQLMVSALRSFLRFLQQRGAIATDLAGAVPGIACWRLTHLPKSLPPEQVERLLTRCDSSPTGRRDYAILLLLARLGLRAGEVVAATLDDLDWDQGEIVVRGKGQRQTRLPLAFLTPLEVAALLAAPDLDTRGGRRDRALLLLAVQTGLRAAELLGLRCQDIVLGPAAHVRCLGKGRKVRNTPLRKGTAAVLRSWLRERQGQPADPAFPTASGSALSHDGLQYLLTKHLAVARRHCPSLTDKQVTPHVLRHTLAMDLLHHGVDRSVIALWLGHESVETTTVYLQADMQLKEQALAKTAAANAPIRRYRPDDRVMALLRSL